MQRLNCERYPCHFPEQDCALCFCPFFPCLEEKTSGRDESGSWSCQDCTVIHRREVAEAVLDSLVSGEGLEMAWKKLLEYL